MRVRLDFQDIQETIAKARIPALTMHDSIIIPESCLPEIKVILLECFDRIGFKGNMVLDVKEESIVNVLPEEYEYASSLEELEEQRRSYNASH